MHKVLPEIIIFIIKFQIEVALKPCGYTIPDNRGCLSKLIVRDGDHFIAVKVNTPMTAELGFFLQAKNDSLGLQRRNWPRVSKTVAGNAYFVRRLKFRNTRLV